MTNENSISYLSFKLNNELFSANVEYVKEVLELNKITKVPKTSSFKRGVINLRGDVLPVISLRQRYSMPEKEDDEKTVIIVFEVIKNGKKMRIGCVADDIQDVLDIEEHEIIEVPTIASDYDTDLLIGMKKLNDKYIMIMNCDKLFNVD